MKRKIIVAALAVALALGVIAAVEMVQSGKWHGGAIFVVVVVSLLVMQFCSFTRQKPVKDIEELDDDDGGIDWREEKVDGEVIGVWKGWAVLLDNVPVHEAKTLAEKLQECHLRCRLELLEEDRAFHLFGNGGMGTRMCVLVAPSDYDAAKKTLGTGPEGGMKIGMQR